MNISIDLFAPMDSGIPFIFEITLLTLFLIGCVIFAIYLLKKVWNKLSSQQKQSCRKAFLIGIGCFLLIFLSIWALNLVLK